MYGRFTTTQLQKYAKEQGARLRREQQQKEQQQAEDDFKNYDDSCLSYFKSEYIKFVLYNLYIYAESEVRLIFSLISSAFLYDREGLFTLTKNLGEKYGWCQGCALRKIVGSPLAWTRKIQGACSAYDFYAETEIS